MASKAAGRLRETVAWELRSFASDGYGNTRGPFAEVFRCSASFEPGMADEGIEAGKLEGRQKLIVRVRAYTDTRNLDSDYRMRDIRTNVTYAVVAQPAETPDRQFIDIIVQRGVAE
jgi:head-tail adaptor